MKILSQDLHYDQIVLEAIKVRARAKLGPSAIEQMQLYKEVDYDLENLVYSLETQILGEDAGRKTVYETVEWQEPKNWWHGVLNRFFPIFAKFETHKKNVVVGIDAKILYPESGLPIRPSTLGRPVVHMDILRE